ncbi:methyltransferase [Klebsiella sp. I138]|uniref:methyltransferase n=1 Tax=Klebsiella sp. I138 TaxID=2755385 RepID=UPI003DA8098B
MMATVWLFLALLNLVVFTAFIIPHKQPAEARPLFPVAAIKLLRLMWLIPILIFGYSLSVVTAISMVEWTCLAIAVIGNVLVIKGKHDLGRRHTWAGYYLPGASAIRTGIFRWLPHPMYTGIVLVILSCSMIYVARLPAYMSAIALICCVYIIVFLLIAAYRESKVLMPLAQGA